mmetsp:Transcript_100073/g.149992  ORF Transcript_100073/g.149992 Transcript_100073/m.149992 type:complete len:813 (+) Transcript_100073:170-2608(+)
MFTTTRQKRTPSSSHHWKSIATLLALLLISSTIVHANDLPAEYVDDIYHCDDPQSTEYIIDCDADTFLWNLDELQSEARPANCDDIDMEISALGALEDSREPCVLWSMLYGNATAVDEVSETPVPAESVGASSPVASPIQATDEPPVGEPGGEVPPDPPLILDPITLTFVWPADNLFSFTLDRSELHTLTSRHIVEALQAELGLSVVQTVNLILTASSPQERSRMETITGNVILQEGQSLTSVRLQASVQKAFVGNAMELYLFRLQIANDVALRNIQQVLVGTGAPISNSKPNEEVIEEDPETWSPVMIAIVASVGAAFIAVCCFAYCLVVRKPKSRAKNRRDHRSKDVLPAVSTNPTNSHEEDVPASQPRQTSQDDDDDDDDDDEENQSVGTSVYSYLNNDDTLSAAPSFLYSIHEADVSQDDSQAESDRKKREKKGLLWSVMDSFQSAFGNDDDDSEEENNDSILGNKKETESRGSDGRSNDDDNKSVLTYDDDNKSFLSVGVDSMLKDDASLVTATPVKQRFEALWKEDDAQDYLPTTVKKSNRTLVYEDEEESGEHTHDDEESGVSDDSPSTLLNINVKPILVDRTPNDHDDDNNKLPLPSALNSAHTSALQETHSETGSVGSNHSSNSSRSSSSRPRFQPTSGTSTNVGSARKKRNSSWGVNGNPNNVSYKSDRSVASHASISNKSTTSARSTDSAKFRSLLNQADTNDAALFLHSSNASTEGSEIPATKLSYDMPSPSNSAIQVSSLIQSFDKAWKDDDESTFFGGEQPFENLDDKSLDHRYHDEKKEDDASTVYTEYPDSTMASF